MAISNDTQKDTLKTRKICFSRRHEQDHGQAKDAMDMLKDVDSIEKVTQHSPGHIVVSYDIRKLSLQMIESALKEVGFTLNNGFLQRTKRAICAYCEDAERERLGCNHDEGKQDNPIQLTEKLAQDPRPNDWRNYT